MIILDLKHPLDIGHVSLVAGITQLLSSVGGLATSWIDGKTAVQKLKQIRMKEATGEIDWELAANEPHRVHGKTNG